MDCFGSPGEYSYRRGHLSEFTQEPPVRGTLTGGTKTDNQKLFFPQSLFPTLTGTSKSRESRLYGLFAPGWFNAVVN